ncbi:hypothetical protein C1H46_027320 [Malus baccata]|uniref:Uncharacterized protein n=1 Tax=Malus baccata TaxID=106549 RepID=A0A540LL45_MALBA|nr:hypothetical protein C1H46_027320 [Malus baccata]
MEEQERKEVLVMNKKTVMMQLFWGLAMVVLLVGCLWFLVLHTVQGIIRSFARLQLQRAAAEHISKNLVQDALKYKMRGGLASVHKIANQGPDSFTNKRKEWEGKEVQKRGIGLGS